MQIEERLVGTVTILDLKGTLTLGSGDTLLKDKVRRLLTQGRRDMVLNLASVLYLNSAGIGEIASAYATASRDGGHLKLVNVASRVRDLLVVTKLITLLETFETEAEAVHSFPAEAV